MPQQYHLLTLVNRFGTMLLVLGILGILAASIVDWLQRRKEQSSEGPPVETPRPEP